MPNIGDSYGKYIVISDFYYKNRMRYVKCKCSCGTIQEVLCCNINRKTMCRKCYSLSLRKFKIGDKYNHLTILDYKYDKTTGSSKVKVQCDCKNEYWIKNVRGLKNTKYCKLCARKLSGNKHPSYKGLEFISHSYFTIVKTNAKNKNREFSITIEDMNNLMIKQNHKCALSGLEIKIGNEIEETTASLDRIDSSKDYIIDNIQWVHKDIQRMKSDFNQNRFIELCSKVNQIHPNMSV